MFQCPEVNSVCSAWCYSADHLLQCMKPLNASCVLNIPKEMEMITPGHVTGIPVLVLYPNRDQENSAGWDERNDRTSPAWKSLLWSRCLMLDISKMSLLWLDLSAWKALAQGWLLVQ